MNTNKLTFNGKINLILGPMWAEKSSTLISRYNRYTIGGKKCLMVKYSKDNRYDANMLVTHNGVKTKAIACEYLYELDNLVENYDVICIDEIQFYKDAHIFCDLWCSKGLMIEACGLNGTFYRTSWPVINKLIPLADDILFLKAVCKESGKDAIYSKINIETTGENIEIIGGEDKYSAVDRQTYFKNSNYFTKDLIKEFADIYIKSKMENDKSIDYKKFMEKINNTVIKDDINLLELCKCNIF